MNQKGWAEKMTNTTSPEPTCAGLGYSVRNEEPHCESQVETKMLLGEVILGQMRTTVNRLGDLTGALCERTSGIAAPEEDLHAPEQTEAMPEFLEQLNIHTFKLNLIANRMEHLLSRLEI